MLSHLLHDTINYIINYLKHKCECDGLRIGSGKDKVCFAVLKKKGNLFH